MLPRMEQPEHAELDVFARSADFVIGRLEGANSDDPRDPGGLTRYGIAQRAHPELDVAQDGMIGPRTLGAARNAHDAQCADLLARRALRYDADRNFSRYGHGWLNRLFRVAQFALRLEYQLRYGLVQP